MPFLCVAASQAARNQVRKLRWLPSNTVPAVTETWRSQAAHWSVSRSRPSSQASPCPQAGHRNPSGQRFSSSQRAQAASSGKRASNSGSDRGSSAIPSSSTHSGTTYSPTGTKGMSHLPELARLLQGLYDGRLSDRNRSMVVLATRRGLRRGVVCPFLGIDKRTRRKYLRLFEQGG